jgi:hypothetical protein
MDRYKKSPDVNIDSPPSEAWLFAQAILGKPIPHNVSPEAMARANLDELEWLAQFSSRHAEELRQLQSVEADARHDRELLVWAAQISTHAEEKLRDLQRKEAEERAAWRRAERFYETHYASLTEWDEAGHPRHSKGTLEGGRWAPKGGGGASAASSARPQRWSAIEPERVLNRIRRSSGGNWTGDRILDVISTLAPGWLPFIKQHVTLSLTSGGSKEASTAVRSGEVGPAISDLPRAPLRTLGPLTLHVDIPSGWNDVQAAHYILSQLADDINVHRLAADWATKSPELFKEIQDQRFKDGLPTIAALAGGYYTAIASLVPGGQAAVAIWDIQNGDKVGAALDIAFMLPLGKLAKAGVEATGSIAIQAGDKLVGVLPVKAIEQIGKLAPEQRTLLHKRLLAAKTEQEAAEIVGKFLATPFDSHHPLARFLGGHPEQLLSKIPRDVHQEFHQVLREELKAVGLDLPIGSTAGSARKWAEYLSKDPTRQGKAFDAVLRASRAIDAKHGTEITEKVWKNLVGEKFFILPGP